MAKVMAEWWLYKCEVCGVAVFANQDNGPVWYNDCCGICKTWTYYDKVVIHKSPYLLPLIDDEYVFMSKTNREEENGDSDTRNGEKT